jgi:hypothetical protein
LAFTAAPGFLVDGESRTEGFACVVHTTPAIQEGRDAGGLPADGVAAVIDAIDHLDLENLRSAYGRIAHAKRLKKKPAPALKGTATTTVTLGIILALKSDVPLETLGQELDRLRCSRSPPIRSASAPASADSWSSTRGASASNITRTSTVSCRPVGCPPTGLDGLPAARTFFCPCGP